MRRKEAMRSGSIMGVRMSLSEDDGEEYPWTLPPSRKRDDPPIQGPFPEQVRIVQGEYPGRDG